MTPSGPWPARNCSGSDSRPAPIPPMKTKSFLLLLAAALLFSGSRSLAATATREENLGFRKLFLDLYVEGVNEASEREAARALHLRLSAATYDLNHDGKLDATAFGARE